MKITQGILYGSRRVDNKFEFSVISTVILSIISTKFFAKCRGDTRSYEFDSSHELHVR